MVKNISQKYIKEGAWQPSYSFHSFWICYLLTLPQAEFICILSTDDEYYDTFKVLVEGKKTKKDNTWKKEAQW